MIDFGASTEGFDRAMARVKAAEKKLAGLEKAQNAERRKEIEKLDALIAKIDAERKKSDKLEAQIDNASSARKAKIIEQLKEIGARLEKNEAAYAKLSRASKANEIARIGELAKANKEIANLQKSANKFKGISGMARGAMGGIGGMIASGVSVAAFKELIDNLDELGKRARDIGVTASQLQELQHQAKLAGISTSELDVSMRSFNRNVSLAAMSTGDAKNALDSMGISVTYANGQAKTQSELLKEIATYFAENAGEAENAGRAARIFGERGAEMLRIFEQGEGVVNKIFDAKGIDEAAKAAEQFKNTLENLNQSAMPHLYKAAGMVAEALDQLFRGESFDEKNKRQIEEYQATLERIKKAEEARIPVLVRERDLKNKIAEQEKILNILRDNSGESTEGFKVEFDKLEEYKKRLSEIKNIADISYKNDVLSKINEANDKLAEQIEKNNSLESQRITILEKLKASKEELNNIDKRSVEYANAYVAAAKLKGEYLKINAKIADEDAKNRIKNVKKELAETKSEAAKVKRYRDELEKRQKAQSDSREEFELQTKIQILQAQGKTREAEALKFAKARNELMEKYGYSLKQAEQVQRTLNELDKAKGGVKAEYSEEAKKQAQKILDRGEGGSIGKKTIEEAQAIVDGKTPEGGFTTSMFKKYEDDPKKSKMTSLKGGEFGLKGGQFALKNLNVDAKATAENLNDEAKTIEQKNSESLDSLVQQMTELNQKIGDLKNTVDGIAIKKGAA